MPPGLFAVVCSAQGNEEPDDIALPHSIRDRNRKTEFEKLKQICHPGVDKNRSPAALKKLEDLSRLPARRNTNLDPYARRSATWRIDQTILEIERMNDQISDLVAAGQSRQLLRDGRQRNSMDRVLDPKGSLSEMMEDARGAVRSLCEEHTGHMLQQMEEERAIIRDEADKDAQLKKELLSKQRNKTEAITAEMAALSGRLAAATAPIPEPDDEQERRRIYIRKLKKANVKAATVKMLLDQGDMKLLYDRSKQMYAQQGANTSSPTDKQFQRLRCMGLVSV
eukprot:COSAG02_NODE_176_length_31159_cov_30.469833_14_plen_281_part_00